MSKIHATAKVTVTLEISAHSTWGEDCKMDQIYKQASDDVLHELNKMINENNLVIRLIGPPKINAILTSDNK